MESSGFRITFSDYVTQSWEERAKTEHESFNTTNNKTVVYHQYDFLNMSDIVYGGQPQPVSIISSILDLSEQEKILRSIIDPDTNTYYESSFEKEHYEIEIIGINDTYSTDEAYSFSYVLSGFGNPCGSIDVTYPVNESENITTSSKDLCTETTPNDFVWDIQKERGTHLDMSN